MSWGVNDIPGQAGKLAIVTGANSGIGYEAAKVLAAKGATVILGCRNEARGHKALLNIKDEYPKADVTLEVLDLSSLASVRDFAQRIDAKNSQLDLLINNAGIMSTPFARTVDGYEQQLATNFLGHFCLTGLLLDLLEAAENARVVALSSLAAHLGARIDFSNLNAERKYSKGKAYNQSKLACLMFAYELQRRLEASGSQTISLAAHPGGSTTSLFEHAPHLNTPFLFHSAADGALPTLRAATDPDARGSDYYGPAGWTKLTGPPVLVKTPRRSLDEEVAKKLWQVSEELTATHYLSGSNRTEEEV